MPSSNDYIDVKPKIVFFANVCNWINRIKSTQNCCAARAVNKIWSMSLRQRLLDQSLQLCWNHFSSKQKVSVNQKSMFCMLLMYFSSQGTSMTLSVPNPQTAPAPFVE